MSIKYMIKKIGKNYYRTANKIKIYVGKKYIISFICKNKLNNDFVIFYIETNYVNKKMIESIKKYIDKIDIYIKI